MTEERQGSPWAQYVGGVLEEMRPGYARISLLIQRHHTNFDGSVHGGVIASLMDSTLGAALHASYGPEDTGVRGHTTVEMNVSYLKAARMGDRVVAEACLLRKGRALAVGEVEIRHPSGDLAAKGRLTYLIHQAGDTREVKA